MVLHPNHPQAIGNLENPSGIPPQLQIQARHERAFSFRNQSPPASPGAVRSSSARGFQQSDDSKGLNIMAFLFRVCEFEVKEISEQTGPSTLCREIHDRRLLLCFSPCSGRCPTIDRFDMDNYEESRNRLLCMGLAINHEPQAPLNQRLLLNSCLHVTR